MTARPRTMRASHEGQWLATPRPLEPSVARIRGLDRAPPAREPVVLAHFPTGSSSLVVCTPSEGGPLKMLVIGPSTTPKYRLVVPSPFFVQFRFHPGAARAVFGVPLHELADRFVSVEDVWGRSGSDTLEALQPREGSSRGVIAALEGVLQERFARAEATPGARLVRHAARVLESAGAGGGIHALADRLGVGERALRQSFREYVGISPKRYARIARIRRVVSRAGTAGWAELALEHGFCDQAHLNAEFRALLELTPRDLLARRFPVTAKP